MNRFFVLTVLLSLAACKEQPPSPDAANASENHAKQKDTKRDQSLSKSASDKGVKAKELKWIEPFNQASKWEVYPELSDVERGFDEFMIQYSNDISGIIWRGDLPQAPYEMKFEARRVEGPDFFTGLTFPVRHDKELVSLILGGWGGYVVGISSVDGNDAADTENPTNQVIDFKDGQWYKLYLKVTKERLVVKLDEETIIDLPLEGKKLSLRSGQIEDYVPLSFTTFQTDGQIRKLRWRSIR